MLTHDEPTCGQFSPMAIARPAEGHHTGEAVERFPDSLRMTTAKD